MRVLYVSKPIAPPWHDGSKNLVRDLAELTPDIEPCVMTAGEPSSLAAHVQLDPVYRAGGGYAPKLQENARVLGRLLGKPAHDLWHFVFAPNPASSSAAHVALAAQRARARISGKARPLVVQTVASAPRSYEAIGRLLFCDVVVAQSRDTLRKLERAGAPKDKLRLIVPCARAPEAPSAARKRAARPASLPEAADFVIYPGDLEVSTGARTVIEAATRGLTEIGGELHLIMACRAKTPRAAELQRELEQALPAAVRGRVHWVGTAPDLPALLGGARAVLFPVDDLYGKVDVPLVLLESLSLGVPMIVARGGPLDEIEAALPIPSQNSEALIDAVLQLHKNASFAAELVAAGRREFAEKFAPEVIVARYRALYDELATG